MTSTSYFNTPEPVGWFSWENGLHQRGDFALAIYYRKPSLLRRLFMRAIGFTYRDGPLPRGSMIEASQ